MGFMIFVFSFLTGCLIYLVMRSVAHRMGVLDYFEDEDDTGNHEWDDTTILYGPGKRLAE